MIIQRLNLVATLTASLVPLNGAVTSERSFNKLPQGHSLNDSPQLIASELSFTKSKQQQFVSTPLESVLSKDDDVPLSSIQSSPEILLEMDGVLEFGDRIAYQDGSLYDEYEINGYQGQEIRIQLESLEFDPYLVLFHPNGDILAQNDDISADNLNSLLDLKLPIDGTYRVVANGFDRHSRGHYRLTVLTINADLPTLGHDDLP